MEEHWADFLKRGKKDLEIAQYYLEHDPEFASYMTQQALEKHTKSMFLRFHVFKKPKKIGHFPMHKVMEKLGEIVDSVTKDLDNKSMGSFDCSEMIKKHSEILYEITRKPSVRLDWWKKSLCIPLSAKDEKTLGRFKPSSSDVNQITNIHDRVFKKNKKDNNSNNHKRDVDGYSNTEKTLDRDDVNEQISALNRKLLNRDTERWNKVQEMLHKKHNSGDLDISPKLELLLYFSIFGEKLKIKINFKHLVVLDIYGKYENLVMTTLSHESIGRYPIILDSKDTTTTLYEEYKDGLRLLVNNVKTACLEIEKYTLLLAKVWDDDP